LCLQQKMKFNYNKVLTNVFNRNGPGNITAAKTAKYKPKSLPVTESGVALVEQDPDNGHLPGSQEGQANSRQQWDNPVEFLLSCVSMSVGLGNVWRFPFTAYENGGGAFLIPYLLVLLLIGRPFYLLELSIGQFSSSGCVKLWDLAPPFKGIGYGQSFATFVVCSYYCVLIATSCYFLFSSFQSVLPWTVCHDHLKDNETVCIPSNGPTVSELNFTAENITVVSSTEQYFRQGVLKEDASLTNGLGLPDPALLGCLMLCWLLIYLTLRKGVSSSGKVAYFTALFPYSVMLTLLVRGLTLPGAMDGIYFFFNPEWHRLYDPKVWYAAVTQSFFSLGIGFGCLSTFSSYNKFNHNIYRDATIISIADTFTSVLAGVITFSILGHLAHELDLPVKTVVKSGAGLAFISYPEVVAKFDFAPQLFSVLFFLMLITLGLGTASGLVNTVITVICDAFPTLSKSLVTGIVCTVGVLSGLVFITPGGQPMLEIVDYYGGSLLILTLAVAEIVALSWVYRTSTIIKDLNFMMKRELGLYWRFCWSMLIPVSLILILAYTVIFYEYVEYAGEKLPAWMQIVGWALTGVGLITFLSVLVHTLATADRWNKKMGGMFSPLLTWGPRDMSDRLNWQRFNQKEEEMSQLSVDIS